MCIRDRVERGEKDLLLFVIVNIAIGAEIASYRKRLVLMERHCEAGAEPVSYTHLSAAELSAALLSFLLSVAELVFCDEQAEADVRIDAQASIAAVNLILSFIVCPFFMRGKYIAEYIIPTYSL